MKSNVGIREIFKLFLSIDLSLLWNQGRDYILFQTYWWVYNASKIDTNK